MGEWLARAEQIAQCDEPVAPSCQRRLSEPLPLPEPCRPKPDYRQHPERYEFPRFVIPTADGPVEFLLAVPKEKYDAVDILDLFIKYHGAEESGQIKVKVE